MKTKLEHAGLLTLLVVLMLGGNLANATPLGTAFTYQGQLTDRGAPANGTYNLTFTLYDDPTGGAQWVEVITNSAVPVSNGLFTTAVDFGADPFDGTARWLEIAVATNGSGVFIPLDPRQPLTPSPYARYAANAGLAAQATTALGVALDAVTVAGILNSNITAAKIAGGQVVKSLNQLKDDVLLGAGTNITMAISSNMIVVSSPTWSLMGNAGTSAGLHFLGTTDNQPLDVRVNNVRALRLESTTGTPNLIGGLYGNTVSGLAQGVTISGGGAPGFEHSVTADFGTIGGGSDNTAGGSYATVGGGVGNIASDHSATVGGGNGNTASGFKSTVGGGTLNRAQGSADTIAGGIANVANGAPGSGAATIGGGFYNSAANGYATVGGGYTNAAAGYASTIGGGNANTTSADADTVGGGSWNRAVGGFSVVSGGEANIAGGYHSVVSGGWQSKATNLYATVAGGAWNIAGGPGAFVGGGGADGISVGGNIADGPAATIGGGLQNSIHSSAPYATIGGGFLNNVSSDVASVAGGRANNLSFGSEVAAIGGGESNYMLQAYAGVIAGGHNNEMSESVDGAVIGGGGNNHINSGAPYATIAGGLSNQISTADLGVIGGGERNYLGGGGQYAVIGGGRSNRVEAGASGVIGGGDANQIGTATDCVIGGGEHNFAQGDHSVIGGGQNNLLQGDYSTIPGGRDCTVSYEAEYALAAGRRAKANHDGAFVWADSTDADFYSTRNNQFAIRAGGGVLLDSGSGPGIALNAANSPLVTRLYDPFTSGAHHGAGRWGVFMEPHTLALGIPNIAGKDFEVLKYNADSTSTSLVRVDQAGNLFTTGLVNPPSDRAVKQDFAPVNPREVLERLAMLPLQTWTYTNHPSARHLGPVAQDFRAAFGLGTDDKHIATVDADGVALAAIQGLNQKLNQKLEQKETEITELKARLEKLEQLLSYRLNGGAQ